jgi:hypothetical protein
VSREAGEQPPDVIDVVFPAPGSAPGGPPGDGTGSADGTGRGANGAAAGGPGGRERLRDRPLLLGAVSIAVVGIAAVIAWQVWPQSPGPTALDRPRPRPSRAQPLDPGGIAGRAAGPLPSAGGPRTSPTPAADVGPSRTPSPPAVRPSVGTGTAAARPRSGGSGAPSATPSGSGTPSTAPTVRTLRAGDSGPDVTDLQRLLFAQGFTYVSLTGVYDDATVRGVTQVQDNRGLDCDPHGVYGPCTRAALTS